MDQKTKKETPFCVAPFLSVAIWAGGESVICCEDKGSPVGRLDLVDDISDLVNSERMCNARKQFMNGTLPAGCGWCLEQSKHQPTVYHFYKHHFKWKDIADCYDSAVGTVRQTQYLLIALSNLCTYSCRMCFERLSTRLSLDRHNMLGLSQTGYQQNNIDKIIRFIRSNPIRFVTFHGGNPIHEPRFLDVLSELSSDTTVEILTNGSTLISRGTDIRPHLERFKHIRFNISLDGTRKTTEYVRVHSDFDAVFRHFTEVKELPNASVNIHNTITNLNLFDLPAYYTMVLWGKFARADGISSYIATEPAIHRVSNLPDELRRRAKYQLGEFLRKLTDGTGPVPAEKITVTNAYVRNVIRRLDSAPYDPRVFAEFLNSTKTTDEFYGFKPLPEYSYYLARSEPNPSEPAPQQMALRSHAWQPGRIRRQQHTTESFTGQHRHRNTGPARQRHVDRICNLTPGEQCSETDNTPLAVHTEVSGEMKAVHVNSTLPCVPYLGRVKQAGSYHVEDFELLTTILSAAAWRRFNGSIKLYTDKVGKDYYQRLGMTDLWDAGIDTSVLESLDPSINYDVFWTAGRTAVLKEEKTPFFSLDTDLIVWRSIAGLITSDFMALHPEPLRHDVYKSIDELQTPPGYAWEEWDWGTSPCNASLMYFASNPLTKIFYEKAMAFIVSNMVKQESVSRQPVHDVFVAQRLLPMCAKKLDVKLTYFLDWPRPEKNSEKLVNGGGNLLFTHVWAYKDTLKRDMCQREDFCKRCVRRIIADYPEFSGMLRHIPSMSPYLP